MPSFEDWLKKDDELEVAQRGSSGQKAIYQFVC